MLAGALPHRSVKSVTWLMIFVGTEPDAPLTMALNPFVPVIVQEAGGFVTAQDSVELSPLRTRVGVARKLVIEGIGVLTTTVAPLLVVPPEFVQLNV